MERALLTFPTVGSGKSVVTAFLVEHMQAQGLSTKEEPLGFFFCDRTSRKDQLTSCAMIYRRVLRQLLETSQIRPPEYLHSIYRRHRTGHSLSEETCLSALIETVNRCCDVVTLVFDALDECSIQLRTSLLSGLQRLMSISEGKLKIFISSRRERDIVDVLETQSKGSVFTTTMRNQQDISLYISQQVDQDFKLNRFPKWFASSKGLLIDKLIAKSQGM